MIFKPRKIYFLSKLLEPSMYYVVYALFKTLKMVKNQRIIIILI